MYRRMTATGNKLSDVTLRYVPIVVENQRNRNTQRDLVPVMVEIRYVSIVVEKRRE